MKTKLLVLVSIVCLHHFSFSQTLYINEICPSNYISYADSTGDNGDWIEIYNGGGAAVDVGGMYLTDHFSELDEYRIPTGYASVTTIPAGGHLIFWFDDKTWRGITHVNQKLAGNGEELALTASDGITIIDSVTYGKQIYDVSFGRMTDGSATWTYFPTPTPKTANTGGGYTGIAGNAIWNYDAGFYPSAIQVELTYPVGTASIYYSLNGNEPSPAKGILYTTPINVDTNATIRARVYDAGLIPGEIKTHSFFINRPHDLPVLAITTDSSNLWDINTGIYAYGVDDYDHSYPYTGANFWEDWKRPAHIELFEANGDEVVDQDLNLSIAGNTNRAYAQKSFDLESKSALGNDHINYPLFPQLPITAYKNLRVRNGGSDWSSTTMRDALNHTLLEGATDVDHQANRPAIIYLNGQYWGILNMVEKITEDQLNEHYDYVDKDSVDLLEINSTVISGDAVNYTSMINYITANTMATQSNYDYIKTQMEVYEFTNYIETRIYYAATDWPGNNIKYWRPKTDLNYKWRWIMWDTDRSTLLNPTHQCDVNHNTLSYATGGGNPSWSIFLINNLLLNNEFKSKFITQFAHHMNFTFCPIRTDSVITAFRDRLNMEMPNHIAKWKDSNNDLQGYYTQGYFQNMARWNEEVDTIRLFFNERAHFMKQFIMAKFGITDTSELTVNTSPLNGGVVYLDSFPVPQNVCKLVYFDGYPITMTARPNPGFAFLGWISAGGDTMPLTWNPNGDTTVTAYFGNSLATQPTTSSTNISSSIINCTDINLNWTSGDGTNRMVVARATSAVNIFPADGSEYTGNSIFGSGDDLGSGNFVVYTGNGNSCTVTGLTAGTQYYFAVIEFNGSATTCNYNNTSILTANVTASTFTVTASATLNSICENASTELSVTGGLTYVWSPSTGLSSTTDSIVTATLNTSVTYMVDAMDALGCHAITTISITVNPPPFVALSNQADMCDGSSSVTLHGGIPSGGTYSGNGVSAGTFDPVTAGAGTHTLTYTYTDVNGCSNFDTSTITVVALPNVTQNLLSDVCANASSIPLSGGSPAGGTYSGAGVSSGNFDAVSAGIGTHTITYSYTDISGCSNSASTTINVLALPNVSLNNFSDVCADASPITLSGGVPAGGTYSGLAVTSGIFDPVIAGAGTIYIQYYFTDSTGCSNSASASITVLVLPTVTQNSYNDACADASPITLTGGNPVGGTYSGTGVTSGIFDPVVAGIGTQNILYSFTDVSGCSNAATTSLTVVALPNVTLNTFNDVCADASPITLIGGNPAGGTYSGTGVASGIFDPIVAGLGTQNILYSYTDANNCSNNATASITVNDVPVVSLGSDTTICVYNNILLDAGAGFSSYLWSTTETSQTILVDSTGTGIGTTTYNVTVSNAFNCTATDELNVTFDICAGIISASNQSPDVIVYPNPFSDEMTIASNEKNITITLYDVFGKIILRKKMSATVETIRPDVSAGIYFLQLQREKGFSTIKVVKTK